MIILVEISIEMNKLHYCIINMYSKHKGQVRKRSWFLVAPVLPSVESTTLFAGSGLSFVLLYGGL